MELNLLSGCGNHYMQVLRHLGIFYRDLSPAVREPARSISEANLPYLLAHIVFVMM